MEQLRQVSIRVLPDFLTSCFQEVKILEENLESSVFDEEQDSNGNKGDDSLRRLLREQKVRSPSVLEALTISAGRG